MKPPPGPCRHCEKHPGTRPRGLCWACYYDPEARGLYASTSPFGRRGTGNGRDEARLPDPDPTLEPGSEAKIVAMIARAERGEALFHPAEPTVPPAPPAVDTRVYRVHNEWRDLRKLFGDSPHAA